MSSTMLDMSHKYDLETHQQSTKMQCQGYSPTRPGLSMPTWWSVTRSQSYMGFSHHLYNPSDWQIPLALVGLTDLLQLRKTSSNWALQHAVCAGASKSTLRKFPGTWMRWLQKELGLWNYLFLRTLLGFKNFTLDSWAICSLSAIPIVWSVDWRPWGIVGTCLIAVCNEGDMPQVTFLASHPELSPWESLSLLPPCRLSRSSRLQEVIQLLPWRAHMWHKLHASPLNPCPLANSIWTLPGIWGPLQERHVPPVSILLIKCIAPGPTALTIIIHQIVPTRGAIYSLSAVMGSGNRNVAEQPRSTWSQCYRERSPRRSCHHVFEETQHLIEGWIRVCCLLIWVPAAVSHIVMTGTYISPKHSYPCRMLGATDTA